MSPEHTDLLAVRDPEWPWQTPAPPAWVGNADINLADVNRTSRLLSGSQNWVGLEGVEVQLHPSNVY